MEKNLCDVYFFNNFYNFFRKINNYLDLTKIKLF